MYVSGYGKYFVVKCLEKGANKNSQCYAKTFKSTLEYTKVMRLVLMSFWQATRFNFDSLRLCWSFSQSVLETYFSLLNTLYLNFNIFFIMTTLYTSGLL